jgi:phospholipid/cholesterol/gamma-HCH transport system substrate-binding protein
MKRSTNLAWSELKVGLLLVAAFLVGTVAIVSFTGIREYFRPTFPLATVLRQVSGLKPGAVVMLTGVRVGNVTRLSIAPGEQAGVRVTMAIFASYGADIRRDARASLGSQGLLGDKYIELEPGTAMAPPVTPGATIAGYTPADFTDVVGSAQDATARLTDVLKELAALTRELRAGSGTAGRLLSDPALYDDARHAAESLTGTAGDLTQTSRAYRDLGTHLDSMLAEDGTLHRLATDRAPFERLNQALERLDAVLARVEAGQGSLGKAVNDPEMADELTGLIKDSRHLVHDMEANPHKYFHFTVF